VTLRIGDCGEKRMKLLDTVFCQVYNPYDHLFLNCGFMRKIDNRQYKLLQIKPKPASSKSNIRVKKGRRHDSKLDRRGMR